MGNYDSDAVALPTKTLVWSDDLLCWVRQTAAEGAGGEVQVTNVPHVIVDSMPASEGGLTDAELRAEPVPVSGTFYPATQPVSGTVAVSNLPATQPVSGTVGVNNFPASQAVTGTFWPATQPVSGTVAVSNFPASQAVTGTFWQATQPISGTVTVGNLPGNTAFTVTSLKSAAPTANAVQATTGALAAGDYEIRVHLACADTVAVGKGLVVEHRNAADNANINVLGACTPNGGGCDIYIPRITLALNERIRVIAGTAAGAASSMYVSSIARRAL